MKGMNFYISLLLIIPIAEKTNAENQTMRTVFFAKSSSSLDDNNKKILSTIVSQCKSGACSNFKILGYADKSGSSVINVKISERRVNEVFNILLCNLKIDSSKTYRQWLGNSDEVYDLHLPGAPAQRRAVDIVYYYKKGH